MNEEDEISHKLVTSLKKENHNAKVDIGSQKQILIGTRCGTYRKNLHLLFQSAKQDIVFYLKDNNEYKFEGNNFFKKFTGSIPESNIIIPLVVFKCKCESVTTHAIRQYSEIARMVKSIFPFCMYNLLLIDFPAIDQNIDKIYMTAKNFDKVIYKPNYNQKRSP